MSTTEIAGDTDRDAASETSAEDPTPRPSAEMQSHARKPGKLRLVSLLFRIGLGVVLLAIGAGVFTALRSMKVEPETRGVEERALLVRTIEATALTVPRTWEGYGTARPMSFAEISAQVSGRVAERPASIEPGVAVRAGELIARVEPADFTARLASAEQVAVALEANIAALEIERARVTEQVELLGDEVELARNDVERTRTAIERGAGMQRELDAEVADLRRSERSLAALRQAAEQIAPRRAALEAQLLDQRARITLAQLDVERTEITSPIDGFIQRVDVEEGELLTIGSRVARVVDLRRIEVPLRMPSTAAGSLGVGDTVTLRVDGDVQGPWEGAVVRVAPETDAATRTVTVFVEVEQQVSPDALAQRDAELILPGRFLMGQVQADAGGEPLVLVPRGTVVADTVTIADVDGNGGIRSREVPVRIAFGVRGSYSQIDPREREWAALEPGSLEPGTQIIVSNLDQLGTGTLVRTEADVDDAETRDE
mgnify:CR=1 FL=1